MTTKGSSRRDGGGASQTDFALTPAAFPGFSAAERSVLEQAAMDTVRQELVLPTDLDTKVPRLLEACQREGVEIRKTLVTISNSQIREAKHAVRLLDNCRQTAEELRITFQQLEGRDSMDLHPTSYRWLKEMFVFRQNVHSVVNWVYKLEELRHGQFNKMLADTKLSDAYIMIREVQKIRLKVRGCDPEVRHLRDNFRAYFDKCNVNMALLTNQVLETLEDTVHRAIEATLQEDDSLLTPIRECLQISLSEAKTPWMQYTGEEYDDDEDESPLDLPFIAEGLAAAVDRYWVDVILNGVENNISDCRVVYENMKGLEPVFGVLEAGLLGLSTSKLPCTSIVIRRLHARIVNQLEDCVEHQHELASDQLVEGMQFAQWYTHFLEAEGFKQHLLKEGMGGLEHVGNQFLTAAVDELQEHMTDLAEKCALRVVSDTLNQLPTGEIFTNGPVDLFHILQMSIAPVTSMAEVRILTQLSSSCVEAMRKYLDTLKSHSTIDEWENRMLEQDHTSTIAQWGDTRMQCLVAYCNDMSKIEENVDLVENKFSTVLEADQNPFQTFGPEIFDTCNYFYSSIANHIETTLQSGWGRMFSTDWLTGQEHPLLMLTQTIEDYINSQENGGLRYILEDRWLIKVLRLLVPLFTTRYLTEMVRWLNESKSHVISDNTRTGQEDAPSFSGKYSRDMTTISEMWMNVGADQSGKVVRNATGAMTAVYKIIRADSPEDFAVALSQFLMVDYGDCPTFVMETLITKRQDLDKGMKAEFTAQWKAKIADQSRDPQTDEPRENWPVGERSVLGHISKHEKKNFFASMWQGKSADEKAREKKRKAHEKKHKEKEKARLKKEKEAAKAAKKRAAAAGAEPIPEGAPEGGEGETESLEALLARSGQ